MGPEEENSEKKIVKIASLKTILFKYWWVLLILIPIIITIVVRLEPMNLVPLQNSAESSVTNAYRSAIMADVQKKFPNLPAEQQASIAEQNLNEILKSNNAQFQEQVKKNADYFKSRVQYQSGDDTYVYLGDIDSYYWLRQSRNIIEKGTQCDVIKDGKCYDSYTLAPNLREKNIDYYPIVIVWVYNFLKIFEKDMTIMQASFLTPLFFAIAFTIPLFLLLRRVCGNTAAVIGTVLVNVSPHVLSRSLGSDSDIYNVFFQILFLWLAVECFYADKIRTKAIWASLAGLSLSLYSLFWPGRWYLADVFCMASAVAVGYILLKKYILNKKIDWKDALKQITPILGSLLAFTLVILILFGLVFFSFSNIIGIIQSHFTITSFKVASKASLWPNVLTTVAEFNSMGISDIVNSSGSYYNIPLYLFALIGTTFLIFPSIKSINKRIIAFFLFILAEIIIFNIVRKSSSPILFFLPLIIAFIGIIINLKSEEDKKFNPAMIITLTFMICIISYFSTIGARFFFLIAVPVSILCAIFFEKCIYFLLSLLRKIFSVPKIFVFIGLGLLAFAFLTPFVKAGFNTAQNYLPMVTGEWVDTLQKINTSSKPDAIINSWWDFGHWFKYFADRRVTLDGSSQNSPQLMWLGKLLLTSNEAESVGILRMLDCGGNDAFNTINEKMNDTPHSIDVLNTIIVVDKKEAIKVLSEHGFTQAETDKVLSFSHCDAPENFLITSQDMIGKSGVWAHFGSWDFKKAYIAIMAGKEPDSEIISHFNEYGINEAETRAMLNQFRGLNGENEINNWISPWPGYFSSFSSCNNESGIYKCTFSRDNANLIVNVDFDKKEAYVIGQDGKKAYLPAAAFTENGSFESAKNSGSGIGLGLVAVKSGDSVSVIYMDPLLTGSMFTRLFFFDGAGLKSFEKFDDTTSLFGERIITWKVKWA